MIKQDYKNFTLGEKKRYAQFVPIKNWKLIKSVNIKYEENKVLRWLSFNNLDCYRRYYLIIKFKNNTTKKIYISKDDKNVLKSNIVKINFYLSNQ